MEKSFSNSVDVDLPKKGNSISSFVLYLFKWGEGFPLNSNG